MKKFSNRLRKMSNHSSHDKIFPQKKRATDNIIMTKKNFTSTTAGEYYA